MKPNDEHLVYNDEEALRQRLATFVAAGETTAALRRKAADAAMKRLASDDLKATLKLLNSFGDEYASLNRDIASGDVSARAARRKLSKHWAKLDRPEIRDQLRPVFDVFERAQGSTSQERIVALFGKEATQLPWTVRHDWFGEFFYEPESEPAAPQDEEEPLGTIQQALGEPYTDCSSTFDLPPRTAEAADGPGVSTLFTSANPSPGGGFGTFSGAVLIVAGGVGVQSQAAVGRSLRWQSGYSQLRVQATIDYTNSLFGYMLGAGISICSAELFVEAFVDNGPTVRVARPLGALVAPVAWGADRRRTDQAVIDAIVTLPPGAGSARLYAGAVSSAATGGVAISAACTASTSGTVRSICAILS
jgi:hypothetical protein